MTVLVLLLYILALVCFFVAAFNFPIVSRVNLIALGLGFWLLGNLLGGATFQSLN
jgi:positive regulator of sigma E activity